MMVKLMVQFLVASLKLWLTSLCVSIVAIVFWHWTAVFFGLISSVLAVSPPPALPSSSIIFADEFELGLGQWQQARGLSSHWSITNDGRIEASLPGVYTLSELVPTAEAWPQEWQNYQFEFEFEVLTNADVNWSWGFQDTNNWYELHFYRGSVYFTRLKNKRTVYQAIASYILVPHHRYQIVVRFVNGRVQAWADGELIIDRVDSTYDQSMGKVTLKATTGAAYPTQVKFDNLKVYAIDQSDETELVLLPMTEFKQHQIPWRDEEYDHALDWSCWDDWQSKHPDQPPTQVTIRHWGCALSSVAMILNYHGYEKMPSGEKLDPSSLNSWLSREVDGYLNEGLINWQAVSRLSRQLSEAAIDQELVLPVLEYHRYTLEPRSYLQQALQAGRPAIIQLPGHYLVGTGYLIEPDQTIKYFISDPAYSYYHLDQHEQPISSIIDYIPSQTDLSQIIFVAPSNLEISIVNSSDGQEILGEWLQDSIINPYYQYDGCLELVDDPSYPYTCQGYHSVPVVQLISQLQTGQYQIQVQAQEAGLFRFQILLYDQGGSVRMVDRFLFVQNEGAATVLDLDLDTTAIFQSSIEDSLEDNQLFEIDTRKILLNNLYTNQQIATYHWLRLTELLTRIDQQAQIQTLSSLDRDRYFQYWLKLLYYFQSELDWAVVSQLAAEPL